MSSMMFSRRVCDCCIDADSTWNEMKGIIDQIFLEQGISKLEFMKLHTLIYTYCTRKCCAQNSTSPDLRTPPPPPTTTENDIKVMKFVGHSVGLELYKKIRDFLRDHLVSVYNDGWTLKDEGLLQFYAKRWERYRTSSMVLSDACAYMNRHWIRREHEIVGRASSDRVYEISQLVLVAWRDHLFQNLHNRVTKALIKLMERERCGKSIRASLVRDIIDSYIELGATSQALSKSGGENLSVYEELFERTFLRDTKRFYEEKSVAFLKLNSNFARYMKRADQWLQAERKRVRMYLPESTEDKLLSVCENALIFKHLNRFCRELPDLTKAGNDEDLIRMYSLLSRVKCDNHEELKLFLESHRKRFAGTPTKCLPVN